jgi:protein SCO1/2
MSRTVWIILAVLALAFAAVTGLAVQRGILGGHSQTAAIGGPFHLVDQTGAAADALGPKADDFQTVFVSVDPGRDTPKVMANYLSNSAFPHRTLGLSGTPAQVAEVAHAYKVFYQKAGDGPDYQVNHSTITYLMSPTGDFVCVIPYGESPQQMAGQIEAAMKQGPHAQSCSA